MNKTIMKLSPEAARLRREYMRAWYVKHPGRKADYNRRYWEKKARQAIQANEKATS